MCVCLSVCGANGCCCSLMLALFALRRCVLLIVVGVVSRCSLLFVIECVVFVAVCCRCWLCVAVVVLWLFAAVGVVCLMLLFLCVVC